MLKNKSDTGYKNVKINHYWRFIEYVRYDQENEYTAIIHYSTNKEALKHPMVITFKQALDKAISALYKNNVKNNEQIYMTPEEYFQSDVYNEVVDKYNIIE